LGTLNLTLNQALHTDLDYALDLDLTVSDQESEIVKAYHSNGINLNGVILALLKIKTATTDVDYYCEFGGTSVTTISSQCHLTLEKLSHFFNCGLGHVAIIDYETNKLTVYADYSDTLEDLKSDYNLALEHLTN
tara:strand:- start:138 stop:539 length:402 start_codon:yes stop_codon:yes gene_type:complete